MKKLFIVLPFFVLAAFSLCMYLYTSHDGSVHTHRWALHPDGSWQCSTCSRVLDGTTAPYMAVLSRGKPEAVQAIKGHDYTYENTSGKSRNVIIKTGGGRLTIKAPRDTVWYFGDSREINIVAVKKIIYGE